VNISYVFAALVVNDRDAAVGWYERLFGRPPDMLPNDDEAVWQLADSASLYVVADRTGAGHGVCTIVVEDVERCADEVASRGIATPAVEEVGTAGRKLTVTDPDGNAVSFVALKASRRGSGIWP
jgi:predicted enzyme related to lactoylglutathione lyase